MIYGIGIDISQVSRFEELINSKSKLRLTRIFSLEELEYAYSKPNQRIIAETLAMRFAAREAFVKALGTGFGKGIYLNMLYITNDYLGKPHLNMKESIKQKLFQRAGDSAKIHLTMSSDYPIAIAQVIIEN